MLEFTYNSSYQVNIKMAPFVALYKRKYWSPLYRDDIKKRNLLGPKMIIKTMEKVILIWQFEGSPGLSEEVDRYSILIPEILSGRSNILEDFPHSFW